MDIVIDFFPPSVTVGSTPATAQFGIRIMKKMKIIRVFISKTNATPNDDLVRINTLPSLFDEADEIHISVTFTWDIARAEQLAEHWKFVAPVKVGGPAYNEKGGDFVAGMYMKNGYVITSRGCNNRCWFCSVPQREGYELRELPIVDGYIITDDNLLACSEKHINSVFEMLKRQPQRPQFNGGLEAKLLTQELANKLYELKPVSMFFAYDTVSDYEPLIQAGKLLREAGFKKNHKITRCYVLIGYQGDTFAKAEKRLLQAWEAGFFPMSMLYRDQEGKTLKDWKLFQRQWSYSTVAGAILKNYEK